MANDGIANDLQRFVDRQNDKRHIHSVVVGVAAHGEVTIAAAGFADAAQTVPMTAGTPYFLASITKMYTATVVMKLAATGDLDLAAPIGRYLSSELIAGIHVVDGTDHSGTITVAQLLSHTSGLADYFEGKRKGGVSLAEELQQGRDRSVTVADAIATVRELSPEFVPGTAGKAHYSDLNYTLLGRIIETVTGEGLAENFEKLIFSPLQLKDTWLFDHSQPQPAPAAMYMKDRPLDLPLAMSSFGPDGGLVATADDSLRFLRAFFGGELLSAADLRLMTSRWNRIDFPLRYGSGLMRFRVPRWMSPFQRPPDLVGHSGSSGSFAFCDSKRDVAIAGTINQMDNPGRPFRLMPRLMALVD